MFTDMKDRQMRAPIVVLVLVLVAMITLLVFALVRPELPGARNTGPILYVQPAATGAGDGSSWSNATTLQDALRNRAVAGDEIWVAAGTHYPDQGAFQIGSGVAVYGGFAGTETSWDARNPAVNITTLSGDIDQDNELDAENSWAVVDVDGTDATTVLDGFIITGGNGGGGIYNYDGSPTFANLTITGNRAAGEGGGVYNYEGNPTFTNVIITSNQADGEGEEGDGGGGGGVYNYEGNPIFTDVIITGNQATGAGGGVYNYEGNPTFVNVTITDNRIVGEDEMGNEESGGGIFNYEGNPIFTNVIITGNRAAGAGGGIFNYEGSPIFTNVTITSNQAEAGGGIFNYKGIPRVRNSIIWGNDAQDGPQMFNGDSLPNFAVTLVQGIDLTSVGTGNLDGIVNPQFVAPIPSGNDPTSAGDYRLQPGSALIDAGAQRFLDETEEDVPDLNGDGDEDDTLNMDLEGDPRVQGASVDLGALELSAE